MNQNMLIDSTAFTMNVTNLVKIEGKRRYNLKIWKMFTDMFNYMPVAALIDDKIFCVHGGLSPDLPTIDQMRLLDRKQ